MTSPTVWNMLRLPALSFRDSLLLDIVCALTVHIIYNKYEFEPANIPATLLLLVGVPALPCYFLVLDLDSTIRAIVLAYGLFYATLSISIVLYRISPVHPLAKYPGPLSLKISKFVIMYHTSDGKQYVFFKKLHEKYGPFVRVGPNEVSIVDVEAIHPVLGIDGMRRGPLWIIHNRPGTSANIVALRDVKQHHERRKLWNRGFTTASLKELQPAIENRVLELVGELGKRVSLEFGEKGVPLDLAQWLANFTYDFMGDMVFGGGFDLMKNDSGGGIRKVVEDNMKMVGTLEHTSWITGLLYKIAALSEEQKRFQEFGRQRYVKRKEQGAAKRDLFHYITNEDGLEKTEVSDEQGVNEIFAAIVAGADTTSTVMSSVFFYLLTNPATFDRLWKEVHDEFPPSEGEPFDAVKLAAMPYLNAVINEALRLQPPLPTSLQRCPLEGSGGKWVAGRFVPENAAVYIPAYVLHRDPRYFSPSPDSFIPERWLDNNEAKGQKYSMNALTYIPFSFGPANCVGKNLALMEARMVIATIVQRFDIKLADGYDPQQWEEELKDYHVIRVGKLPVVLKARV
ncbi:hypothetical protein ACEPAH_4354 [Sanghuangporus vaninii]